MSSAISPRDWETLSAYLDDALSAKERQQFATQLEKDAQLRGALQRFELLRAQLRSAPQARPPRHFTLTPEMLGSRSPRTGRVSLSFSMLSAVASLLLVVVLMGDFATYGLPFGRSAATVALEAAAPVEEPAAMMAQSAEEAGEMAQEEAQEDAAGVGGADEAEEQAIKAPPPEPEMAESERAVEEQGGIQVQAWLRAGEIVLAAIALTSGLAAWRQRRAAKQV